MGVVNHRGVRMRRQQMIENSQSPCLYSSVSLVLVLSVQERSAGLSMCEVQRRLTDRVD